MIWPSISHAICRTFEYRSLDFESSECCGRVKVLNERRAESDRCRSTHTHTHTLQFTMNETDRSSRSASRRPFERSRFVELRSSSWQWTRWRWPWLSQSVTRNLLMYFTLDFTVGQMIPLLFRLPDKSKSSPFNYDDRFFLFDFEIGINRSGDKARKVESKLGTRRSSYKISPNRKQPQLLRNDPNHAWLA